MREIMYEVSSLAIAAVLFFSMAIVIEAGYRIGRLAQRGSTEPVKTHVGAIQTSLLGILALLLGFTFSLALNRHDSRSESAVTEANAIGTTWLRSQLLPPSVRSETRALLRKYVNLRIQAGGVNLTLEDERDAVLGKTKHLLNEIWAHARQAAVADPNPVTTGLFIQSLNEMIDAFGSRDAALKRHVPELVMLLLYGTFLMTGAVMGFTAGFAGHRTSFVTYIMVGLIVVLVFIIVDLDRPRRGLIHVSQESLLEQQAAIHAEIDDAP